MSDDQTTSEMADRIARLNQRRAELFAEHQRLHEELVGLFERIKQIHNQPPVLGDEPPDPPPPPPRLRE